MSDFQLGVEQLRATHDSVQALQAVAQDHEALQGSVELLEQIELQQFYALCNMVNRSPNMVNFYAGALQRVQITQFALGQLNGQVEQDPTLVVTAERAETERAELEAFFGLFAPEHPTFVAYCGRTATKPVIDVEPVAVPTTDETPKPQIGDTRPVLAPRPQIGDTRPAPTPASAEEETLSPHKFNIAAIRRALGNDVDDREAQLLAAFVEGATPGEWFNRSTINLDEIPFNSASNRNSAFSKLASRLLEAGVVQRTGERKGTRYLINPEYESSTTDAPAAPAIVESPTIAAPATGTVTGESVTTQPETLPTRFDIEAVLRAVEGGLTEREEDMVACILDSAQPNEWFRRSEVDLDSIVFSSASARNQAFSGLTKKLIKAGVLEAEGQKGGRQYIVTERYHTTTDNEPSDEPTIEAVAVETSSATTGQTAVIEAPIPPQGGGGGAIRQAEEHEQRKREERRKDEVPRRMNKRYGLHSHGIRIDGRTLPYDGIEKGVLRQLTDVPRREPVTTGFLADKLSVKPSEVQSALGALFGKLPQGWLVEVAGSNGNPNGWRLGSGIGLKEQKEKK